MIRQPKIEAKGRGDAGIGSMFGVGMALLATVGWSTSSPFIAMAVRGSGIAPISLAFWRVFGIFTCLLVGLALTRRQWLRIARRDLVWFAGLGMLAMGSFQVLWVQAVLANGASVATVIQCNAPMIVTLLAWVFWREALTWRKWAAIGLSFAGTVLIAIPATGGNIQITSLGLLISLASALAYAGITLFTKQVAGRYNSWTILFYTFGFATLALLPFQFGRPLPQSVSGQAWAGLAGLVLVTGICGYAAYAVALRRLQASVASIVGMAEVPLASFWGYIFLGERLDGLQILGALIVVSGVLLLSLRPVPHSVRHSQPGTAETGSQ